MLDRIRCGDCLPLMAKMPADSVRLIVADPPYYNVLESVDWDTQWSSQQDYLAWTEAWINAAMRLLVPGGLLYCFGQLGKREHVFLHLMSQSVQTWQFHDLVIWDRAVGYNDRGDSFTPAYEMLMVLRKNGPVFFNKDAVREPYPARTIAQYARDKRYKDPAARMAHLQKGKYATNLWRVPSLKGSSKEKVGHPSQKPEAVIERIVRSSSAPGDTVLDPFLGSGTTAVVAARLGRHWIGIEREPRYAEMARQRIRTEKLKQALAGEQGLEAARTGTTPRGARKKQGPTAPEMGAMNEMFVDLIAEELLAGDELLKGDEELAGDELFEGGALQENSSPDGISSGEVSPSASGSGAFASAAQAPAQPITAEVSTSAGPDESVLDSSGDASEPSRPRKRSDKSTSRKSHSNAVLKSTPLTGKVAGPVSSRPNTGTGNSTHGRAPRLSTAPPTTANEAAAIAASMLRTSIESPRHASRLGEQPARGAEQPDGQRDVHDDPTDG